MAGTVAFVTVRGLQTNVDLQVPMEVPIETLVPTLLEALGMARGNRMLDTAAVWGLGRTTAYAPLSPTSTLQEAGVVDGETLLFQDMVAWRQQRGNGPALTASPDDSDISVTWQAVEGWSISS